VPRNPKSLWLGRGHESWSKGRAGINDRAPEIRFAPHYYGRARSCVTNTSEFSGHDRPLSSARICIRLARRNASLLDLGVFDAKRRETLSPRGSHNPRVARERETYAPARGTREIRHEPKWNSLPSFSLFFSFSFSLAPGSLVAATFPPDIWLSFQTVRNGFVRSDEPEHTGRVRANYRELKHDLPGQIYIVVNVVTFPLSNLTFFFGYTLPAMILVK